MLTTLDAEEVVACKDMLVNLLNEMGVEKKGPSLAEVKTMKNDLMINYHFKDVHMAGQNAMHLAAQHSQDCLAVLLFGPLRFSSFSFFGKISTFFSSQFLPCVITFIRPPST